MSEPENLNDAMEFGLALLQNKQVNDVLQAYHSSVQDLASMSFADRNWHVKLGGGGLDGSYPGLYIEEPRSGYWRIGFHRVTLTQVYFVHNLLRAGDDSVEDPTPRSPCQNTQPPPPVLNFILDASAHIEDLVRLSMTSNTRAVLKEHDYGLDLEHSVIKKEEKGVTRYFLESQDLAKKFELSNPHVLFVDPKSVIRLPCSLNRLLNEGDVISEFKQPGLLMDCTKSLHDYVAIPCHTWPEEGRKWSSSTKWPSKDVVTPCLSKLWLVPAEKEGTETAHDDGYHWKYCFVNIETALMKSLTPKQQVCYMLVSDVMLTDSVLIVRETWLKYAFFWMMEECSEADVWKNGSAIDCLKFALKAMSKYFTEASLKHYFLPEYDLFSCDENVHDIKNIGKLMPTKADKYIREYASQFFEVLRLWDLKAGEVSVHQQKDIQRALVSRLEATLQSMFDEEVRLAHLQLYARISYYNSVEECIEKMQDVIKAVAKLKPELGSEITVPMQEVLTNLLGNLYLVKAMSFKPEEERTKDERNYYAHKTEDCLLQSHTMDLMAGKVKLANFFYMSSRWTDAIQLLQEVLQHSAGQERNLHVQQVSSTDSQQKKTRSKLWHRWIDKNYLFPFLVAGTYERSSLPQIVRKNIKLSECPLLGILNTQPVYYLDADMYARILLVLSLIKAGQKEEAMVQLATVENLCEKDHFDHNDKRSCTYYNLVAHCYLELGKKAKAVQNLQTSLDILPNPRNPARMALVGLQTERFRRYVVGSVGAAAAIGVAAIVVAVSRRY